MGFDKEYSSDEYAEEVLAELVCLENGERLGFADRGGFPSDYDEMETVIELLLRRGESAVPWSRIPVIQSSIPYIDPSTTPLLTLPIDIILLIYDHLSIYDAICFALTSTVFYNLSRRRLSGVICPNHIGTWAGKHLVLIDETMKYKYTFRKYPAINDYLKNAQRGTTAAIPKYEGGHAKKLVDTPFKLVSRFPSRLPWESQWEYNPSAVNAPETVGVWREDARKYRTQMLAPDLRRMQSLWYQWQCGTLQMPEPIRRFIEGLLRRNTHLSFLRDDGYVFRNLDKMTWVRLDGLDAREMVRKVIFGPDGSNRGKLSPGFRKWCGDRFDIVRKSTMQAELGWEEATLAGPTAQDRIVDVLQQNGFL